MSINIEAQFREAMRDSGIDPPSAIVADGNLHRFATNGESTVSPASDGVAGIIAAPVSLTHTLTNKECRDESRLGTPPGSPGGSSPAETRIHSGTALNRLGLLARRS